MRPRRGGIEPAPVTSVAALSIRPGLHARLTGPAGFPLYADCGGPAMIEYTFRRPSLQHRDGADRSLCGSRSIARRSITASGCGAARLAQQAFGKLTRLQGRDDISLALEERGGLLAKNGSVRGGSGQLA